MSNARLIRLRLLATSSLLSAGLAAGFGLVVAPSQALAAGECGAPAGGAVSCAPAVYPVGITYVTVTPLTVTLQQTPTTAVSTTTGGVSVTDAVAGDALNLNRSFTGVPAAGSTAPSLVNLAGNGVLVAGSGAVTVNLGAPTTDTGIIITGSTNGLVASSTNATGPVVVTLTNGTVTGQNGAGILANANGGILTVNAGAATIHGTSSGITVNEFAGAGPVTINSTGAITATAGDGVDAIISNAAASAPITVNVGGLVTSTGFGVDATTTGVGAVTVNQTAGDIEASGSAAINVSSTSGAVIVTQSGTIGAAAAPGVGTFGSGIVAASTTGPITVTANSINVGNEGVSATSTSGNVIVNTTVGGLVQAQGDAIMATSGGAGTVTVNVHGNVIGDTNAGGFGAGLELATNTGAITVNTDAGTTIQGLASPFDIDAISTGGNITITAHSLLNSPTGTAINANTGGAGVINIVSTGSITAGQDGIDAVSNASGAGAVSINNGGDIGTAGAHLAGNGLSGQILNPLSLASVTVSDSASIFANGPYGIRAFNLGSGASIILTGNGTAATPLKIDPSQYGDYSFSAAGPASVVTGSYNTYVVGAAGTTGNAAVFAQSGAAADVAAVPSVVVTTGANNVFTVAGNDSFGIYANNNNGPAGTGSVVVTTLSNDAITVSGSRDIGIFAQSIGLGNVSVTTNGGAIVVNETGVVGAGLTPRQAGIDAESVGGAVAIVNGSAITVTGSLTDPSVGIFTATNGVGTSAVTSTGAITSNNGNGITTATASGSNTVIANGSITTPSLATSTSDAISATAGTGPVSVTVGPAATLTGGSGVVATGSTTVGVDNSGVIRGFNTTTGNAVNVTAVGTATISNHTGATLSAVGDTAADAAVVANSTGGLSLTNAGTITTTQAGHNGIAVASNGSGAGTIANTGAGLIDGRIIAVSGGFTVNNAATFSTNGTNSFGNLASAPTNTLNNSGRINAGLSGTNAAPAASVSTTNFNNLGALNNSGLISMTNGIAGDTLATTGTYTGSGAGALAIDVMAAPVPVADKLTAGGLVTGSTAVTIVPVGGPGLVNGAVIAHGAAGSSATAFTVAPGSLNQGFIHYGVVYNAGTGNYQLFGSPNGAVYETALFGELQTNLWYKTSDAWSDHMSELRDAHGAGDPTVTGVHTWGVFTGGQVNRDANRSFTAFGQTSNYNIGYDQNYVGAEAGIDGTSEMYGGAVVYGLSGGYIDSHAFFSGTNDVVDAHAYNIGAYLGYQSGGLFINGLVKYDNGNQDVHGYYAGYRNSQNINEFGGTLELGYRFAMGSGWFVEPVGSISYVKGQSHNFTANGATFHLSDDDSSRGKLGLRAGTSMDLAWGSKIVPYAHAEAVDEFRGNGHGTFTSAGQTISFSNTPPKTFGEAGVGVDLIAANGFTSFFEGHGDFGNDQHGYGGRVGIRWKW
jgi:outer membrane autotransporter protein